MVTITTEWPGARHALRPAPSGRHSRRVDAARPLRAGHVLSVETTMLHPSRGFIKLEDTVVITETGHDLLGDRGRGWNRGGQ